MQIIESLINLKSTRKLSSDDFWPIDLCLCITYLFWSWYQNIYDVWSGWYKSSRNDLVGDLIRWEEENCFLNYMIKHVPTLFCLVEK